MIRGQQILEADGLNGLERITVNGQIDLPKLPIPNIPGRSYNTYEDKIMEVYMGESDIEYDETKEVGRSDEELPITKKTGKKLTQRVKTYMLIPPWKEIPAGVDGKNIKLIDIKNPAMIKLYREIAENILKNP